MNEQPQEGSSYVGASESAQDDKTLWLQRQQEKAQALIAIMQAWRAEDEAEDPEKLEADWEALKQALDEDRLSYRKLFP